MKRGEIWTVAGGGAYAGKPRPVVIIQDDDFDATGSVTLCPFTSDPTHAPLLRLLVLPNKENGLRAESRIMVDKVTTVARTKIGAFVGQLDGGTLTELNRALVVFLGLATSPRTRRDKSVG